MQHPTPSFSFPHFARPIVIALTLTTPLLALAGDSATAGGAASVGSSACPNLPGFSGTTPPTGMIVDPVGNCIPGSSGTKTEVQPKDFSYTYTCQHIVSYTARQSSWSENRYYYTIDLVDTSYKMLYGDSPNIFGYNVPNGWSSQLRVGRCSSNNNQTVTNDLVDYNVNYYQPVAGGYIAGLQKLSALAPVVLAPFSKATKIGCAYQDGGTTPGAQLLTYSSQYDFSSTNPTSRVPTSWGFSASVASAASGWSIYYNVAPKAFVASQYSWDHDLYAMNMMAYVDYVPVNYNYTGGPVYSTYCVAPGKTTYGLLALDRVILGDGFFGSATSMTASTVWQGTMVLPR